MVLVVDEPTMTLTTEVGVKEYEGVSITRGPHCHSPGCRGYGSTTSGVVFVGIAPGRDEVKTGRPLTGPSGALLNNVLEALGYNRQNTYCTNLICWYKDDPSPEEAALCSSRLQNELHALKPKLIVLLGKIVSEIFLGRPFGKVRGAVQWSSEYNCYIMSTYHPAAILRSVGDYGASKDDKSVNFIHDFVRDINKIKYILEWKPEAPQAKIQYKVIDTVEEAQQVLNGLPRNVPVALDVETKYDKDEEETEALEDTLLCVGVGTTDFAWVFTPDALYRTTDEGYKISALNWPNLQWICHYGIFDTQIMATRLGVWLTIVEDTLLQSYSLDERKGIHKLKPLTREYLAAPYYEETKHESTEKLYEYNAHDVVYTARLCKIFTQWQIEDNVRDFYLRILIPSNNIFNRLQHRGINIDTNVLTQLGARWGQSYIEEEALLQDFAKQEGWPTDDFNPGSTKQLQKFLFEILSLPVIKHTNKDAPSTDKEVLEALSHQHPFVQQLQDFRHLTHMFDSFIKGIYDQVKEDGRAHAIPKLHGSRTGRPSYTKPALQTIPTPFAYADNERLVKHQFGLLRRMFTRSPITFVRDFNTIMGYPVPDEDDEMVLIESDYGKAELWMAYAVSGDQTMYKSLISADYHKLVAAESIFHIPYERVTGNHKLIAKRVNFGILYDIEEVSLSKLTKTSVIEARQFIAGVRKRNAEYERWARETQRQIQQTGELVTKSGRKRRIIILGNAVRALKQAVNFPIQSTTSDVVLSATIELHDKLTKLGGHLLFTVHDSILSEVPRSRLSEALQLIHDTMTKSFFDGVPPFPVEIKVGINWGATEAYHDCALEASKNKVLGGKCLWN